MSTQPDSTPDLDLDAWLDDLELATETVTVYSKASLVATHNTLNAQLREALQRQRRAGDEDVESEATLGNEENVDSEVDRLTAAVDANYREMKASGRAFTFTAVTQEVYDDLLAQHTDLAAPPAERFDSAGFMLSALAAAAVPRMSLERVNTLRRKLPTSEFQRLAAACSRVLNGSVDLPL